MTTLTETVIDVADQRTTTVYLGDTAPAGGTSPSAPLPPGPPWQGPMPFGSEAAYVGLHQHVGPLPVSFAAIRGRPGQVLSKLRSAYADNKYWNTAAPFVSAQNFWAAAWANLIPLEAELIPRLTVAMVLPKGIAVSPVPRVLVYPFGWSTWLSLRVVGAHDLADLRDVIVALVNQPVFQVEGQAAPVTLGALFQLVGAGVREDVFSGPQTADFGDDDRVLVSTVLAKHGGSPAPGALTAAEQATLQGIIRPVGPPSNRPFKDYVYSIRADGLEYVLMDQRKCFIWLEHLLKPEARNRKSLRCYHNNTLRSLVHAGHLAKLIDVALARPGPTLAALGSAAQAALEDPPYVDASLRQYLGQEAMQARLARARARWPSPATAKP